ncbi:MAG TPA: hypothetical protein VGK73_29135 [Polyangiaceae bacterium]
MSDVPIGMDVAGSTASGGTSGTAGDTSAGTSGGGTSGGGTSGGAAGSGASGSAGESGEGGTPGCQKALCAGREYDCGDCEDNDLDGVMDAGDPDCLGPCDNTEDSYYPDIPGQNGGGNCRQDCYFDQGMGANDQCYSSFRCDPYSVAPDYPPSGEDQCAYDPDANIPGTNASCGDVATAQADMCLESCGPLVPNGCDCFGCCELPAKSGRFVWIGSTVDGTGSCNEASLDDPTACKPCTQVPSCSNPCDECEICAGRLTPGDDCTGGEGEQCPLGRTPCGLPGQAPCTPGEYCITGCCQVEPR